MKYGLAIALLALMACERQIPFRDLDFEKKLVINALNEPEAFIETFVGSSTNSIAVPELDDVRGEALVLLKEDDIVVFFDTVIIHDGTIHFPVVAQRGMSYQMEMALEGYPTILTLDSVPRYDPQIEITSVQHATADRRIGLKISDVPGSTKYMLEVLVKGYTLDGTDTVVHQQAVNFSSDDRVFVSNINTTNTTSTFALLDDRMFQGGDQRFEVIVKNELWDKLPFQPTHVQTRLSCISEASFSYYLGILENNHIYGGPLAMRAGNNGNVLDGLGLFAFRTTSLVQEAL